MALTCIHNAQLILPDGQRALSWSLDGTLRLWDLESGDVRALEGHGDTVDGARCPQGACCRICLILLTHCTPHALTFLLFDFTITSRESLSPSER